MGLLRRHATTALPVVMISLAAWCVTTAAGGSSRALGSRWPGPKKIKPLSGYVPECGASVPEGYVLYQNTEMPRFNLRKVPQMKEQDNITRAWSRLASACSRMKGCKAVGTDGWLKQAVQPAISWSFPKKFKSKCSGTMVGGLDGATDYENPVYCGWAPEVANACSFMGCGDDGPVSPGTVCYTPCDPYYAGLISAKCTQAGDWQVSGKCTRMIGNLTGPVIACT